MAQQVINIGAAPNDGQGTPLRNSFDITNQNFTENYGSIGTISSDIVTISSDIVAINNKIGPGALFLDAGDTVNPITTIDLSLADTQAINIVGDTTFNFTNQEEGRNYTLIPSYAAGAATASINFPSNFNFSGDTSPVIIPGSLANNSFNSGTGFSGQFSDIPYVVAVQSDGKTLVGGAFMDYNGTTAYRIIRLNADGTPDSTWTPPADGFNTGVVYAITIQTDGKILCGGAFQNYGGAASQNFGNIIRLNTNGSVDTTFVPTSGFTTGFNGTVRAITLVSDGNILVGGEFTSYGNVPSLGRITKLSSTGAIDGGFNTAGANNTVYAIALQTPSSATSDILIGGDFTDYNGDPQYTRMAKLSSDGDEDFTWAGAYFDNGSVRAITLDQSGNAWVGGTFTTWQGLAYNRILQLDTSGYPTDAIDWMNGDGFNDEVLSFAMDPNDNLYVGGRFTSFNKSGLTSNVTCITALTSTGESMYNAGTVFEDIRTPPPTQGNAIFGIGLTTGASPTIIVVGDFNANTISGTENGIYSLLQSSAKIYYKLDLVAQGTDIIANF